MKPSMSYTTANRKITISGLDLAQIGRIDINHPVGCVVLCCVSDDIFGSVDRTMIGFATSPWMLLTKNGTTGVS